VVGGEKSNHSTAVLMGSMTRLFGLKKRGEKRHGDNAWGKGPSATDKTMVPTPEKMNSAYQLGEPSIGRRRGVTDIAQARDRKSGRCLNLKT